MGSQGAVVLVVEDEPQMADLLRELVESAGYAVEQAASGAAALARIAAGGIDLVLLDRRLPDLDGLKVCRRVRARREEVYQPIIVLTGLTDESDRHAGFAAGANDYLGKPFAADDLLDRVQVWANTRQRLQVYHGELVEAHARLAALDRQREEFLALVSHELRQPVAAIAALAGGLVKAPDRNPEETRALQSPQHQAGALGPLADNLLAVAQLEAGRFHLQRAPTDLGALAAAVARETAEPSRVRVALSAEPVVVEADAARLGQAVDNLLRNALKYSPADADVHVAVEATPAEARVVVRDEGVGLTAEEISRLFEKYGRARSPRTTGIAGTGLGLYLTRLLVESHGGRVAAASSGPGQGATFTITLPRHAPAGDGSAPTGGPRRVAASGRP